jgi:cell division protein ZapB
LGGNIDDLEKAKAEIQRELRRTAQRSAKAVKELEDRLDGYQELLNLKDAEIEKLKTVNKELFSENRNLKTKQNKLSDSITALEKNKKELASKVAIASQLRAENIAIKAVSSKGKEKESPFRNRQLEKIKVDPSVKAVILKINSPGGSVTASDEIYETIMRFRKETAIPQNKTPESREKHSGGCGFFLAELLFFLTFSSPSLIALEIGVIPS